MESGLSVSLATLAIGIALIPSTLKFFQGAIVDYFQEYGRKRFIIFGGRLRLLIKIKERDDGKDRESFIS